LVCIGVRGDSNLNNDRGLFKHVCRSVALASLANSSADTVARSTSAAKVIEFFPVQDKPISRSDWSGIG
jgi:hypothetical protein